jgi:soluble cytochrome b562
MSTIEDRADKFETEFLQGLRSSTVDVAEREKYRVWVDQVEDQLDNMAEAYKEGNVAEAHEELEQALEAARNINHFMLNSKWSSEAESMWRNIRGDLNTIAKHHRAPPTVLIGSTR